jgi:acetoin utilization protein AcuB
MADNPDTMATTSIPELTPEDSAGLQRALCTVEHLMTREAVTLRPDQSIGEAMAIFGGRRFRHLPVTDGETLVGIVSDRDLLRFLARKGAAIDDTVSSIMSRTPVTISAGAPVSEATRLIIHHRINCLPVVSDSGQLLGILTTTDLLRALYAVQHWIERRLGG